MNYFKCLIPLITLVSVILANHCTKNHCFCCQNDSCGNHADPFCVGCLPGYTGKYCDIRCPNNCKNCAQLDNGTTCFECLDDFYDQEDKCSKRCRPECTTCVSKDQCTSCRDGFFKNETAEDCRYQCTERCASCWSRDDCKLCHSGYYGRTCEKTCGGGCNERVCDIITGFCVCEKQQTCERCVSGKFGDTCEQTCPVNCIDCTSELSCDDCKSGYYGTTCELNCSNGCFLEKCWKSDGTCMHAICHTFFSGEKCDMCIPGRHGHMCSAVCPTNCYSCVNETNCDQCLLGYFGNACEKKETAKPSSKMSVANIVLISVVLTVVTLFGIVTAIVAKFRISFKWNRNTNREPIAQAEQADPAEKGWSCAYHEQSGETEKIVISDT